MKFWKMCRFYLIIFVRVFVRDYSFFNNLSPSKKVVLPKLFRPDVKINIISEMEKEQPEKYNKRDVIIDNFAKIYLNEDSVSKDNKNSFPMINVNRMRKDVRRSKIKIEESLSGNFRDKDKSVEISDDKLFLIEKYLSKSSHKGKQEKDSKDLIVNKKKIEKISIIKTLKFQN